MRAKQISFKGLHRPKDSFGGESLKGHPKGRRPLDSKLPVHLTLRAARSVLRLPAVFGKIENVIDQTAAKYGVKIYKRANVGNHLHMVLKLPRVQIWAAFIRELTGRIGWVCKGLVKKGLWLYRPHTRLVRGWKRAFEIVLDYIGLNQLEAEGRIARLRAFRPVYSSDENRAFVLSQDN